MKALNKLYNESYKQLIQWKLSKQLMQWKLYKQLMQWKLYKQLIQWKLYKQLIQWSYKHESYKQLKNESKTTYRMKAINNL